MAYAVCIVYCDSYNYFACVYRVVLVVFVSKDAIKSVPSNNNHLSPPLAASASCPSSTCMCVGGSGCGLGQWVCACVGGCFDGGLC